MLMIAKVGFTRADIGLSSGYRRPCVRIVAILLILTFGIQILAQAQGGAPIWSKGESSLAGVRDYDGDLPINESVNVNNSICVPKNIAITKDVYNAEGADKTIINIQDAHASLSAQDSIVSILDSLVTNYDLSLVAIEGSSGYIDTSILKTFPDENIRKETAKYLMRNGRMSAGEFFSITSGKPIALYGIEDKPLYNENLEQFRSICEINESTGRDMKGFLAALKSLQNKVYSKELIELDSNPALHNGGKISFRARLEMANSLAVRVGVDHQRYRNLSKLAESLKLERGISFDKANGERDALIDALSKLLAKQDLEQLVLRSLSFKSGKISKGEYYLFLQQLARKNGVEPEPYEDLIRYTGYITLYESIDLLEIFEEFGDFEDSVKEKLITNDDERRLYNVSRCANYVKRLFEMKLTGTDLKRLERYLGLSGREEASSFIKDASIKYGVVPEGDYDIGRIFENIPKALEFYRTAGRRNSVMFSNTIKRMSEEGQNVAAIITGGYHTKALTEILRQKETSYLIILPKFDASKGERPYAAILTNKKEPYGNGYIKGQENLAPGAYFEGVLPEAKFFGLVRAAMAQIVSHEASVESAIQILDQGKDRLTKVDIDKIRSAIGVWISNYEAYYAAGQWRKIKNFEPMTPQKFRQFLDGFASDMAAGIPEPVSKKDTLQASHETVAVAVIEKILPEPERYRTSAGALNYVIARALKTKGLEYGKTAIRKVEKLVRSEIEDMLPRAPSKGLLIFDLDGTLYRSPALEHAYMEISYRLLENKGVSRAEMDKRVSEVGGATLTAASFGVAISEITEANIANIDVSKFGISPNPHIKDLLVRLKSQGYDLVVLTNNNNVQARQILKILGLEELFTEVFSSEDLGFSKPNPYAFSEILGLMGVDPGNAVSIGDSRVKDIAPAKSLGMRGIEIKGPDDLADNLSAKLQEAKRPLRISAKGAETDHLDVKFGELLKIFRSSRPNSKVDVIESAYKLAKRIYGSKRFEASDESYISHALAVGMTLARWGADEHTIAAALLHKIPTSKAVLRGVFKKNKKLKDTPVEDMVVNLFQTSRVIYKWPLKGKRTIQNYMNMMVKLTGSPEKFRLLLADKLNSIPKAGTQDEKEYRFREIRHIYAPMAERLGLYVEGDELRDEAFKFTHPTEYAGSIDGMRRALGGIDPATEAPILLQEIKQEIAAALQENGVEAEIQSRRKAIYSSWEKGKSDRKPEYEDIDLLEDILGLKIITRDVESARRVICDIWSAASKVAMVKGKIRQDLISRWKKGYDAAHLNILCDAFVSYGREFSLEVMIMTREDNEAYQFGIQSMKFQQSPVPHWVYKLDAEDDMRKEKLKQVFDLDHYPAFAGSLKTRFYDWLKFLDGWNYIQLITTETRGSKLEIVNMQVVELPKGGLPVDLASHPGVNRMDADYRGLKQVDVTRHAEYAVDLERARKTALREDAALFTGQCVELIKEQKVRPVFSKDNFDRVYHRVEKLVKFYRSALLLIGIKLYNETGNAQEAGRKFDRWVKDGKDTITRLEVSQAAITGRNTDIAQGMKKLIWELRLHDINELYACVGLGYITVGDIVSYLLNKKIPYLAGRENRYRALAKPGLVWAGIGLTAAGVLAISAEPVLGLKLGLLIASIRTLSGAAYSNLNKKRASLSPDERPGLEERLKKIVNAMDPGLKIEIVEDDSQPDPIVLAGKDTINIRESAAQGRPFALIYAIAHEAGEANLPAFLQGSTREIGANISILPYMVKYIFRINALIGKKEPQADMLPAESITTGSRSREDLIAILDIINSDIPVIQAADIDRDLKEALLRAIREDGSRGVRAMFVRNMVENRKAEITYIYNSDINATIEKASSQEDRIAVATTEKIAMNDPYTFSNMELSAKSGIQNAFIYGDILKTEEEARAYAIACGYKGGINDIKFIAKSGRSRRELVRAIGEVAGVRPDTVNIGIRAAEGELLISKDGEDVPGVLLEIPEITVNGYRLYPAMNSYQALLGIMTQLKDGLTLEGVIVPGVSYESVKRIFRYLPRAIPIDYGREIEAYRRAIEYVRTAA